MTPRDEVVRYFVSIQPASIRRWMIKDRHLRQQLGISDAIQITSSHAGDFGRTELFRTVRLVLSDREPRTIIGRNGVSAVVSIADEHVQLEFGRRDGSQTTIQALDMMLLSPHSADRTRVFNILAIGAGITGPDPAKWSTLIAGQPLNDDEFEELVSEFADSVPLRSENMRAAMMRGSLDWREIVPSSLRYYERFCGPDPKTADGPTYFKGELATHRALLIERDLLEGLDLCIVGFLRDDLSPARLIKSRSNDEIWAAVEKIEPYRDPFSALAMLDIGIARSANDERFGNLAMGAIDLLSLPEFRQSNKIDAYAYIPSLVSLIAERFHHIEGMTWRPAYWRRLCAWMHAGLFTRSLSALIFPSDFLEGWAESLRSREDVFLDISDLRTEPMWTVNELSPQQLRAEIVGRMCCISSRYRSIGAGVDICERIDAFNRGLDATVTPRQYFPGPLDGHLRAADRGEAANLTHENERKLRKKLDSRLWTKGWRNLGMIAKMCRIGDELLVEIRGIASEADFGRTAQQRNRSFGALAYLCQIAATHRNEPLARAIGARSAAEAASASSPHEADKLLRVILMASAAIENESDWSSWLDQMLRTLVANLPRGPKCAEIQENLQIIARYMPQYRRAISRSLALSELGK